MDLETFAEMVCETHNLTKSGTGWPDMSTDINKPHAWRHVKHTGWLLTSDKTIRGQTDTTFPIEIVSAILHVQPASTWRMEIEHLFEALNDSYEFETNRSCGFHVHLSPGNSSYKRGDWTLEELKNIAMAVVYFEDAFEVLIPETRRGSKWHRPNRAQNRRFEKLSTKQCLREISKVKDMQALCLLIHQTKNSNWNFMNTYYPHGIGTVEFRQPPGVTDAAGCLTWAELAVDFVQSARRPDLYAELEQYPQTVEGLKQFCYDGMTEGVSNSKFLDPLFEGRSGALQARWADEMEDHNALIRKECYDTKQKARI
ncbi:hypothetical protein VMCG_03427 [Cytospora schulzeri]|uniref:Amidoligase enzyme n=1 Tax=Cytospora schulzeri TaxID=448051 RepID=A0A423WWS7_9PEZI|nr:hypothetical protein VMCG_03427 [Valsa malicola]